MRRTILIGAAIFTSGTFLVWGQAANPRSQLAEVIQEILACMEKLTGSLNTIKDEETAKAARPELRKAAAQWREILQKAAKIRPPSQEEKGPLEKEFKKKLKAAQEKLFAEIARVKGVPGGKESLQEIRAVLGKNSK